MIFSVSFFDVFGVIDKKEGIFERQAIFILYLDILILVSKYAITRDNVANRPCVSLDSHWTIRLGLGLRKQHLKVDSESESSIVTSYQLTCVKLTYTPRSF